MFEIPHELSNYLENEEILVKWRIHFSSSFFVKDFVNDRRTHRWSQNPQKNCLWQCNKPCDLKPLIRSSFSKKGSKKSLLGKLLIEYISSIAPSTSNIILGLLMSRTVAQVQSAIQYRQKLSTTFWNIYWHSKTWGNMFILSKTKMLARS